MGSTVYKHVAWGDEHLKLASGYRYLAWDMSGAKAFTHFPEWDQRTGHWQRTGGYAKHLGDKIVFPEDGDWRNQLYEI